MTNYQLQGTDGCYESSRGGPVDADKIWLRILSEELAWHDLEPVAQRYLPEEWLVPPEEALVAGHMGGDYFEVREFVRAIRGESPPLVGIHEAMDMTLPGLISQQSIARRGEWLPVPDSRNWEDGKPRDQLQMVWPEDLLDALPTPNIPSGYELRQYRREDKEPYIRLMHRAGFAYWDGEMLDQMLAAALPGGFFVLEHVSTGTVVAAATAAHMPTQRYPFGGELSWVAADPDHRGKGLGLAVCAAAVRRFLSAGYRCVYIQTDDFRLPALKTYLKLGFRPMSDTADMEARWREVLDALDWDG